MKNTFRYLYFRFINKKLFGIHKRQITFIIVITLIINCFAQDPPIQQDSITQTFYQNNNQQIFWFSSRINVKRASEWMAIIESAGKFGIEEDTNRIGKMRGSLAGYRRMDALDKKQADWLMTSMVLNVIRTLQEGKIVFDYDEIKVSRDIEYVMQLLNAKPREHASDMVARLDCKDSDYLVLKKYLLDSISKQDAFKYKEIVLAMNYRRYLSVVNHPEYILVNLPETQGVYYRNNLPVLKMRVVAGKKKSPTPLIAAYVTSIVTFPFWNVPHTVAVDELLPKVQKDENYLEQNNFDIVDAKGNVVEESDLKWKDYNARNFPYYFRQSSGADNSLGVLKFNLQNPFSIFLHSTSVQSAFTRDMRFLSHGCIRLEKPFELAIALLRGNIDIAELKGGKKNTVSNTIPLPVKIPVFIIYSPVVVDDKKVTFLPDVYGLIK